MGRMGICEGWMELEGVNIIIVKVMGSGES